MALTIRWAKECDLSAVNEMRAGNVEEREEKRFRNDFCPELALMTYQKFFSDKSDVLVAELDGEVVGFALIDYIDTPQSAYFVPLKYYHLEEFGVSEKHRREGIATAMIRFMKEDAVRKGYTRMELDVWAYNSGARALYEKEGFKPVETRMAVELGE